MSPARPRGTTARADLLRLLALAERERVPLDVEGANWFGYERRIELPELAAPPAFTAVPGAAAQAPPARARLPLRLSFLYAIVERKPRDTAPRPSEPESARAEPLDPESARPLAAEPRVGFEDLVPKARLLPALRRHLGTTRPGPIDVARLADELAAGRVPRVFPRRAFERWHPALVVVLDFADRLRPYREDLHRLAEALLRHCGRSGLSLRALLHGPRGPWSDWIACQDPKRDEHERDWSMPPPGTAVLLASDFGLLRGKNSPQAREWLAFVAELLRAGLRPLALAPLGAEQLSGELARRLAVLRWSPDARLRPSRAATPEDKEPSGLAALLAMVAAARRADPPLLRALRRANPAAPNNAGLEGALWSHADVEAGSAAAVRASAQERHLARFHEDLAELHARVDALRREHHAHLPAVLAHEETLLWAAHASEAAVSERGAGRRVREAQEFLRRLAETLARGGGDPAAEVWLTVAEGLLQRADERMAARHARVLEPLLTTLAQRAARQRRALGAPGWADPATLEGALPDPARVSCWLVERDGALLLQARPPRPGEFALGPPLELGPGGARYALHRGEWMSRHARVELPSEEGQFLAPLDGRTTIHLETPLESVLVAPLRRPRGVESFARDARSRLQVTSPRIGDLGFSFGRDGLRFTSDGTKRAASSEWSIRAEALPVREDAPMSRTCGIDSFGVYVDLDLETPTGHATQRLRWIEPGEFHMGSPEDEPQRDSDEGPQHPVRITRGFWLADTACTQAFWKAVMGNTPSHFQGDEQLPVERVSWEDVQRFLRRMKGFLPGCEALLPTEAQWEYACRAGTTTPFSFGTDLHAGLANFDGKFPYGSGPKGEYRERTVSVKSFPANPWGLHEMHGNVWEWCADGMRDYDTASREDPVGDTGPRGQRVVRGGSWINDARGLRSAYRGAGAPAERDGILGFRFSLRSMEPGQAPAAPGGRKVQVTLPRDEAAPRAERAPRRRRGKRGK